MLASIESVNPNGRVDGQATYNKVVMVSDRNDIYVKGRIYSREPDRLCLYNENEASFKGNHKIHQLQRCSLLGWKCSCGTFKRFNDDNFGPICSHVLAIKYILASGEYVVTKTKPKSSQDSKHGVVA